jgi:uncharacterized membrane protein YhaH (DUF805 family)
MEWMLMPLKRYADFQGRSRRKEYWMFTLGVVICYVLIAIFAGLIGSLGSAAGGDAGTLFAGPALILFGIFVLAILIPSIAVQVRRFHDQDKSGWFVLLGLIPYLGGIVLLVFMCIEGTRGPNRFGPDPKDPTGNLGDVFS